MTHARPVVRGANYALTRRTNFRKAFLGAWHPGVDQAWLYTLAHAQRTTGVSLHCVSKVLNHHHIDLSDPWERRPEFVHLFHGELSRALNTLLGRERYDAPGQIFADTPTHVMRLLDAEAQAAHLVYESVQAVAAGLVRRPEDMPGFVFDFGLWRGTPVVVDRPDFYFDATRRDEQLTLTFEPPAKLYRAFDGDIDRLIHHMRRRQAEAIRRLNRARAWPVMGAQRIRRLHPYSEPRTRRQPGGDVVPTYKQGASGLARRRVHIEARSDIATFRRAHRAGVKALRSDNEPRPVFPYGTYKVRKSLNVDVERPDPSRLVTGPEPTLAQVREELAGAPPGKHEQDENRVQHLLANVSEAFRSEAHEVVQEEALEFVSEPKRVPDECVAPSSRPDALVQHRFDRRRPSDARRLVVQRDARRGRPDAPESSSPSGSDPPR